MRSSQKVVVGCRVRPLLSSQDNGEPVCIVPYLEKHNNNNHTTTANPGKSPFSTDSNKCENNATTAQTIIPTDFFSSLVFDSKKKFTFDQVFFPDDTAPLTSASSPVGIFSSMVLPLIDAATGWETNNSHNNNNNNNIDDDQEQHGQHDGPCFNASLLLYGQTCAGKTHCLSQLIHPVVTTLIDRVGCENLMFRMIEIQNDNLRDLLASSPPPAQNQNNNNHNNHNNAVPKMQLRDAGSNQQQQSNDNGGAAPSTTYGSGVQLTGATLAVIESEDDAMWLFQEAFRRRATAPTGMNASSSRSHAIFSIFITFPDGRVTKLDLVDLAGSERQKKTQNSGKRMKESVGINSDLLALGNVLRAVATNQNHIGYRQCKLTRLLQDSIGGRSITAFLACVSPLMYNKDESLRTLQYSAVASSIVNTPIQVIAPPPVSAPQVAAAALPTPASQQPEQQQQQQKTSSDCKSSPEGIHHQQQATAAAGSPSSFCKQCKVLAAALDRSENHAFTLENQIAVMNDALQHAQSDLKKDERIFVMKFKEAKQLSKENETLKKRILELEAMLVLGGLMNKATATNRFQQQQQQQQQESDAENEQQYQKQQAPPTSSRFASARVRGPCFSYDFDKDNNNNNNDNIDKLLPSEDRDEEAEPPLSSHRNKITESTSVEQQLKILKMSDETRKLVVLASLDASTLVSGKDNNNAIMTSPFTFQQTLMKQKLMSQHHLRRDEEDGPVYSLSPSPREREEEESNQHHQHHHHNEQNQQDDNFSRTFVSSTTGSRHLNFDNTSMLQQHHR